jgi:hypothetical protein
MDGDVPVVVKITAVAAWAVAVAAWAAVGRMAWHPRHGPAASS